MDKKAYEEAQKAALEKVYLSIAETGKPTQEQLDFIKMMEPKKTPASEMEDMGKAVMAMMGFMEGK